MSEQNIEEICEILTDLGNGLEALSVDIKQRIAKILKTPRISEEPFFALKWDKKEGNKLKEYETTTKAQNSGSDNFHHCLNILTRNKATIQNRFHDKGWGFSYWLYPQREGTIYRQILPKK